MMILPFKKNITQSNLVDYYVLAIICFTKKACKVQNIAVIASRSYKYSFLREINIKDDMYLREGLNLVYY